MAEKDEPAIFAGHHPALDAAIREGIERQAGREPLSKENVDAAALSAGVAAAVPAVGDSDGPVHSGGEG